ncbi:MAG: hypothetical protein QOJ19_955 [Acidimicrobiia bacterium]|jgi:hypothetical protein|nr:hypothetical protein [Acidimicrobiia bacterium]
MLGDLLYEEQGQITGTRVLTTETGLPRVETSFRAAGTFNGAHHEDIGTYESVVNPDGTLIGNGHGLLVTDNGAMASWTGLGTVRMLDGGRTSIRGAVVYQTTDERLRSLNGACGVFEHEVDADGKSNTKVWHWR